MLDALGRMLASTKSAVARFTMPWQDAPVMDQAWDTLVSEGYRKNSAVFSCIRAGALAFPEPPMVVKKRTANGSEIVPNHPFTRLLNRPNPHMGRKEFMSFVYTWKAIGGTCYVLKRRSAVDGRTPVELWPLHPGVIQPVLDSRNWIVGYKTLDQTGTFRLDPTIKPEDVIVLRWAPDPRQPQVGLSPIVAIAREVDTDNEAGRYVHALLKNDATPRTVITVKGNLREDAFQRIQQQFRTRFGGDNRGDIMIAEGSEMAVNRIGLNLSELADAALRRVPETRISAAYEVPAILAGLGAGLDSATYSNATTLKQFWTETTLIPRWDLVADAFTLGLLYADFTDDDSYYAAFDTSEVRSLSEDVDALWTRLGAARRDRIISLNEARVGMNFPKDTDPRADVVVEEIPEALKPGKADPEGADDEEDPEDAPKGAKARRRPFSAETLVRKRDASLKGIEDALTEQLFLSFKRMGDRVVGAIQQKETDAVVLHFGPEPFRYKATEDDITVWLDVLDHDDVKDALDDATLQALNAAGADLAPFLGVKATFSRPMPEVQDVLDTLASRIVGISDTTKADIRSLIGKMLGREGGASPDQLAKAVREHVEQTYRNRAMTIALTESGNAYNAGQLLSYAKSGVVSKVKVHDGDYDDECKKTNGKTWTLAHAANNLLAHPRCRRAFIPIVD